VFFLDGTTEGYNSVIGPVIKGGGVMAGRVGGGKL